MIVINILILDVFFTSYSVFAKEFDSDDDMYMFVSPDQHLRTPRLEDFFWTGSGDGPPPPDSAVPAPSPSTPIVRTTTVLATVYLDSYPPQAVTDKTTGDCILNCGEISVPDSLEPEIPEDRRYWLLTVIQGSTPDSLQLRLARLYQKAFLRQQERHLGIIKSLDAPTPRKKHDVHSFVVNKEINLNLSANSSEPVKYLDVHSSVININDFVLNTITTITERTSSNTSNTFSRVNPENLEAINKSLVPEKVIKPTKLSESELWVLVTPTVILKKREISKAETQNVPDLIDIPLEEENNETTLFKREILKPEQQPPVRVHIQNITESSETGSVQIVYVVLVGGRAVPAAVAARDMRLVRDAEVASELGAAVTTKAEPAYLKAAEGLEGAEEGVHGVELWAMAVGASVAVLILLVLLVLLCFAHRRKTKKSAASFRAYRNELMREVERSQMKQVHEERDGKLISVVSPSRTRPSSTLLPVYRAGSASGSSTTSSGVSEVAAALRRRQKKPHALKMPHKKRVGTTDSLLVSAGLDSSDSAPPTAPHTPTSYLSMPSIAAFPRGNTVEPLSRILEPVSVRHLDMDSPPPKPSSQPRRQMTSQLVRLGSIDKDPGVIGPLVWDLHCQRVKSASKSKSPVRQVSQDVAGGPSRMRQRFNELVDDAFTLFGSASSASHDTYTLDRDDRREDTELGVTQARNDNVRLATADTTRGRSAGTGRGRAGPSGGETPRPRTSFTRVGEPRAPPSRAWGHTPPQSLTSRVPTVNPNIILAEGRLPADDPALPLISAIKDEIKRVRDNTSNKT
ncbi:PREDICTED: uncharacterized protein LOC106120654 [Papilio xuthus]|uniref:Uncharacterized protein LOC106120654 n=1 Tax=Papilio xuthus TaxID=66420 RepID=A0AAJ6ZFB9_PAPXU|nr:PREDICTED: uncharacterized protein LOC106120654 [Papilio xuthus]